MHFIFEATSVCSEQTTIIIITINDSFHIAARKIRIRIACDTVQYVFPCIMVHLLYVHLNVHCVLCIVTGGGREVITVAYNIYLKK